MNIENSKINQVKEVRVASTTNSRNRETSSKFADELKEGVSVEKGAEKNSDNNVESEDADLQMNKVDEEQNLNDAINGLNSLVNEFNQSDDKLSAQIKNSEKNSDNNSMINNDYNIQENKDILPQMTPNMNFSGNGQPFSSFMNNENNDNSNPNKILGSSIKDLAEESAILSTMAENIAMVNRNQRIQDAKVVMNDDGIKRVNSENRITIENIVKYDSVLMNQADVEVFVEVVEKGEVDLRNISSSSIEKSIQVSKTLNNLLLKSMENNQPLRIDFDNNISVIIRISRDGKISADFLPSSQIAEAYLKENLPLLRQRFEDNNIEYDSLNQRERKDSQKEQNKKKGRDHE